MVTRQESRGADKMSAGTLLIWLLIGAVAGWLAGLIVKGGGPSLLLTSRRRLAPV
jgi:hypothetical protein